MAPFLRDGQLVLAKRTSQNSSYNAGQVVFVQHIEFGFIVKRIDKINPDKTLNLKGDGLSTSGVDLMGIKPDQIEAKFLMKLWG